MKLWAVTHTCNPSTQEVETGESPQMYFIVIPGQVGLQSETLSHKNKTMTMKKNT